MGPQGCFQGSEGAFRRGRGGRHRRRAGEASHEEADPGLIGFEDVVLTGAVDSVDDNEPSMRQILPGIYQWSWQSPEKAIDFNGLYITADGDTMLVDPAVFGPGDKAEIDRLGEPRTIVITNRHHGRRAAEC